MIIFSRPTYSLISLLLLLWVTLLFSFRAHSNTESGIVAKQKANKKLVIATTEYAPQSSDNITHKGFINHIISTAFKEIDYDVEFVFMPWGRVIEFSALGKYDAVSYGYYNAQRERDFIHSDSIITEHMAFFVRKGDRDMVKRWDDFDDLLAYRMGLTRSYTYEPGLMKLTERLGNKLSVVNSDFQNMKMLLLGRIDIFPIADVSGWYLLHKNFAPEQTKRIDILRPYVNETTTHVLFPKVLQNSKALNDKFNKALKKIRDSGVIAEYEFNLISGKYTENN